MLHSSALKCKVATVVVAKTEQKRQKAKTKTVPGPAMSAREREGERKLEYEIACHGSSGVLLALVVVYGSSRERTCFNLNNVHTRYRRRRGQGKNRRRKFEICSSVQQNSGKTSRSHINLGVHWQQQRPSWCNSLDWPKNNKNIPEKQKRAEEFELDK